MMDTSTTVITTNTTASTNNDEYSSSSSSNSNSIKMIFTETVYHFWRGAVYGAAYSLVTPFSTVTTTTIGGTDNVAVKSNAASSILFRAAPPLSQWRSIPSVAMLVGSMLACQRCGCKSMEYIRRNTSSITSHDSYSSSAWINDTFGYFLMVPYYQYCLAVPQNAARHNLLLGGMMMVGGGCLLLVNF